MIDTKQTMKDFLYHLTLIDYVALISTILLVAGFLEKIFNIKFIGSWTFKLLWIILKFFIRWLFMPFQPQVQELKKSWNVIKQLNTKGSELESKLIEILDMHTTRNQLSNQILEEGRSRDESIKNIESKSTTNNKQIQILLKNINSITKELKLNGGNSVKDAVVKISDTLSEMQSRLDINDIYSSKMVFKMDDKGECVFVADSFLQYFDWLEKDIYGTTWNNVVAKKSRKEVEHGWRTAYEHKQRYYNEQYMLDRSGNEHRCLVRASPIIRKDKLIGFIGIVDVLDNIHITSNQN